MGELTKVSIIITLNFKRQKATNQVIETGECIKLLKNTSVAGIFMSVELDLSK